jgi:hypothetical protein
MAQKFIFQSWMLGVVISTLIVILLMSQIIHHFTISYKFKNIIKIVRITKIMSHIYFTKVSFSNGTLGNVN